MANVKITQLTADANPASTDVLPFVDISADETKKVTIADLLENAGNGSAGAPAFAFDNDADTGMYRTGANALGFTTGGTGRLFIDSSGNVGIGNSSPGDLVEVKTGLDRSLLIRGNRTSLPVDLFAGNPASGYGLRDMSFSANTIRFGTGSSSGTTASERMRLDSSGRLGLGVSNPGTKLTVGGEDNPTIRIHTAENGDNWSTSSQYGKLQFYSNDFEYNSGGEMASICVGVNNNFGQSPSIRFNTTTSRSAGAIPTERMRLSGAGHLGIGESDPDTRLHVKRNVDNSASLGSNTASTVLVENTNANGIANIKLANALDADGHAIVYGTTTSGSLRIMNQSAERMRIDSSGRLLVGASSSSGVNATLQVIGDTAAQFHRGIDAASGASIAISKSRNTTYGSNTIVQDDDLIGTVAFRADDGTDYHTTAAFIGCHVDGTPGANDMPGRIVLATTADGASSPTERMRITRDGTVRLSNSPGIDFSGIQTNASGISSEILDSYEEGTFTPVLLFGNSTANITYNARAGFYVKVGKVVHAWVYINLSSKGTATGAAAISQFPFTTEDINVSGLGNWPGAKPSRRQNELSSDLAITMIKNSINAAVTNGAGVSVTDSTFTNGTIFEFALCYRAA